MLHIDIETYSSVDLKQSGLFRYVDSPNFEILLLGYSLDGGAVRVIDLAQGEHLPIELSRLLLDPAVTKTAYNAPFEWVCLSRYLGLTEAEQLDWLSQWRCTLLHGLYLGYPAGLSAIGKALGLESSQQKLSSGTALIRYFSTPCKATKSNGGRTRNLPADDPEKWELYKAYNAQDVVTEMEVAKRLEAFPVPAEIQREWELDQRINLRGVMVDLDLVQHAIACFGEVKDRLTEELEALKAVRGKISRVVVLTGTPAPNSTLDLWAQVYLLDQGERLGKTLSAFRERYFNPDQRGRDMIYSYAPKSGADHAIQSLIGDICISMKAEDYLQLPEMITNDVPVVLDPKARGGGGSG